MEIYREIKKNLFQLALIALALQLAYYSLPIGRDDTDGATRSGLVARTDARTGCQYLETAGGGITPRLDAHGNHICVP